MTLSSSPRLIKAGLVLVDPGSARVRRVIALQYNPEKLRRSLQVQGMGDGAERSDALRLKGPAVETFQLEAEIDASDQLEFPERDRTASEVGIAPQLAVLEALVNPRAADLLASQAQAASGILEIAPMESDLALFVWGAQRIVPVRVTDFSISEEAFDPQLNPINATVTLGLRVLSVADLGFEHKGGGLFMAYLQSREKLAGKAATFGFDALGIGGLP
ncbi:hypothetical protein SAMN05216577_11559 [Pseudomonas citronellolis]|jgi:hypothetical protein|uniref:Uncharacterized protein n=1 Tax=Pseudomonas citronellolis TaxID=53408 RepID=A0AAQ1HVD7_9PSED|nr:MULTISPECIES: hypothetical protein [Pseudomonas]MCL6693381.1 hypothetical protein [Pseudomonas sp. R3.Fl]MCP1607982.1 hypothetical protein [Pseudomonas citronellolis]MCP1644493.1 hypothetical protein [Pseudomonas citronellolis]MCP1658736.1 hypothetical protein [Pseudomonas citronellolis]MCP1667380.1 hypothetical protein [Pseudomonas citronellolis]